MQRPDVTTDGDTVTLALRLTIDMPDLVWIDQLARASGTSHAAIVARCVRLLRTVPLEPSPRLDQLAPGRILARLNALVERTEGEAT